MVAQQKLKIIRKLLAGVPTKYRLAKETGASIAWVVELLKKFEEEGLVKGTLVKEREKLIEIYIKSRRRRRALEAHIANPEQFFRNATLSYALTTYAAEEKRTHTLFTHRWDAYIKEEERDKWLAMIMRNGLLGAGNVRLFFDDEKTIEESERVDGLSLVSEPQLLIDLREEGGVCETAYQRMIDVRQQRD